MTTTTRATAIFVLGLGVLAPLRAAGAGDPSSASLSGPDVVARVVAAYRTCATYRDTGVVRTVYFEETGQRTQNRPFKTAFVRPDSFRFEFTDSFLGKTTRYIVSQQGADVRRWWDVEPGTRTLESLDMGLAGATGVSGGSAHVVPSLLLPEAVSGRSLKDMTDVKRLDDAPCGSAVCARLEGFWGREKRTLWVDLGSFQLRRIDSATVFPKFRTEQTTTYEPTFNQAVSPDSLSFDPVTPQ
jgi:hypothetical protein